MAIDRLAQQGTSHLDSSRRRPEAGKPPLRFRGTTRYKILGIRGLPKFKPLQIP